MTLTKEQKKYLEIDSFQKTEGYKLLIEFVDKNIKEYESSILEGSNCDFNKIKYTTYDVMRENLKNLKLFKDYLNTLKDQLNPVIKTDSPEV